MIILNKASTTATLSSMTNAMILSSVLLLFVLPYTSNTPFVYGAYEYKEGQQHNVPIYLDETTFPIAMNDKANPFWFLKFYAPWCGHCKKMTPVLEKIAPKLKGKMAIGKIDCTRHRSICDQFHVKGFPTLKYKLGDEYGDYNGGRDEGSIVGFANRMSQPPITTIKRLEEATRFSQKKTEDGIAFLASDKQKETSKLYEIYEKVARRNQATAYFLWMEQPESHEEEGKDSAYVSRVEAGVIEPKYYDMKNGVDGLTVEALEVWIQDQNVPTLVELGPSNFPRISKKGRPLFMGIVDMENEDLVKGMKSHIMDYILTAPQAEVEKYYFGIFDGKKWSKFLEQFKVKQEDNPQYLILDTPNKLYWRNETYTKIRSFLHAVNDGSIEAKAPDKSGLGDTPFGWIADKFMAYFPYSLGPIFILICLIVILVTPSKEDFQPKVKPDKIPEEREDVPDDEKTENETKKDK